MVGYLKRIHEKTRNTPRPQSPPKERLPMIYLLRLRFALISVLPPWGGEGGGVVGTRARLWLDKQSGAGNRLGQDILSSLKHRAQLWDSPSLLFMGYPGPFQRVKQPGAGPSGRAV